MTDRPYPVRISVNEGVVHASLPPRGRWYETACQREFAVDVQQRPPDSAVSCRNCQRLMAKSDS